MLLHKFTAAMVVLSGLVMAAFIYLFLARNASGLSFLPLMSALGLVYVGLFTGSSIVLARFSWSASGVANWRRSSVAIRLALFVVALLLIYIFLDSTVFDYYQPISLHDEVILALAISWGSLSGSLVILALLPAWPQGLARAALVLAVVALAGPALMAVQQQLNAPPVSEQVALHRDVFVGGEGGYDIYRIPALLVLPAGSRLASGEVIAQDRLLAMAEARRDGALDTGVIDIVMKVSVDGGDNWQPQQVICSHDIGGRRGKCGNATPVFDRITGTVMLAYNLSGIPVDTGPNRPHSAHIVHSDDGGQSWGESAMVAMAVDNLVFGPGHGIQKVVEPFAGRLVIPAYTPKHAVVLYSDDHGQSWQRSGGLDTGNETEVAELADGRLYMTTRHRAKIGRPPSPNGRLFSISDDGGQSWPPSKLDIRLSTPVCQASVERYGDRGGLLFSNPSDLQSRVNMTIQYSRDDGEHWPVQVHVYGGPAGYSVLGVMSSGDVSLLYERGAMSYSEKISFARVGAEHFD
ncbi:MAG: hypothetical protein Hals2KO_15250 [Halioglobus sp.]